MAGVGEFGIGASGVGVGVVVMDLVVIMRNGEWRMVNGRWRMVDGWVGMEMWNGVEWMGMWMGRAFLMMMRLL